jgi:hypothetical protein
MLCKGVAGWLTIVLFVPGLRYSFLFPNHFFVQILRAAQLSGNPTKNAMDWEDLGVAPHIVPIIATLYVQSYPFLFALTYINPWNAVEACGQGDIPHRVLGNSMGTRCAA